MHRATWHLAVALALAPAFADARVGDAEFPAWVARRAADWQPTREERRFDEIGWARDIRDALRLAKEHHRPVFLFTHDGRMNVGRC